jgi:hypothetical protein
MEKKEEAIGYFESVPYRCRFAGASYLNSSNSRFHLLANGFHTRRKPRFSKSFPLTVARSVTPWMIMLRGAKRRGADRAK